MAYDPDSGELLPDGSRLQRTTAGESRLQRTTAGESRLQRTTAGELVDWLAAQPPTSCGCENPQPWNLCCVVTLIPAFTPVRDAPRRRRR